jgi:hypothetical protein
MVEDLLDLKFRDEDAGCLPVFFLLFFLPSSEVNDSPFPRRRRRKYLDCCPGHVEVESSIFIIEVDNRVALFNLET